MNIIISGATKGIGRAIAESFAAEGFNLFICSRNQADLDAMKKALTEQYQDLLVHTRAADVSKKSEVLAFADFINQRTNKIDVLVNNAGVFRPGLITEEEDGVLETLIETNLYSAYRLTRAVLPLLRRNGKGHIFNMCSIASILAYPHGGSYSISKFALLGFSKVLREELKETGIKVTAILPGATWSAAWAGAGFPEERLMQAADIAKTIWSAYQLSDSAVVEEIIVRPQLGDL
jgi:short-subunit dehydrogenase